MSPEQILAIILSISPWLVVKIIFLILLLFYGLFAAIVWRQIILMNQVVEAKISPFLQTIGLLHFAGAIILFLFTLVVL